MHATVECAPDAHIGTGTRIWMSSQVRSQASIGTECILGRNVFIDANVAIGNRVKIQNNVSIYHGVTLEDGVFVGPHVCFTNDLVPRAITPDGRLKQPDDWIVTPTLVKYGASIGANSVIRCGITIGEFALIGAGSVVTSDVPPHTLVFGNPARPHGLVCRCGQRLTDVEQTTLSVTGWCPSCQQEIVLEKQAELIAY